MIIQCTECQTRFKLADDKMKPAGVRVRCTSCDTVFTALPPTLEAATATTVPAATATKEFSDSADFSDLNFNDDSSTADGTDSASASDQEFDFDNFNMEGLEESEKLPSEPDAAASFASDVDNQIAAGLEDSLDIPDFSLEDEPEPPAASSVKEIEAGDLPPLEDFDLDEDEAPEPPTGEGAEPNSVDDISFEDEFSIGGDLGVTYEDDSSDDDLPQLDQSSLGTQEFSFDDTPDEPLAEESTASAGPVEFAFDGEDDPFALPEEELKTDDESPAGDEFIFEDDSAREAETPPASAVETSQRKAATPRRETPRETPSRPPQRSSRKPKTKRRKKRGAYRSVLLFILLLVVAGAGYVYFGWQEGSYEPAILIERAQQLIKGQITTEQSGQIDITGLQSQFVANQAAGTLFVVSGKAVNSYSGARSTISVRGIIYDAGGKTILQQTAFCGNPLDEAALRTLPYSKIEETMNNQFGDSLSNLNIDPGQSIPFTLVFRNIPDKVAEFNVEVADSRPGTKE